MMIDSRLVRRWHLLTGVLSAVIAADCRRNPVVLPPISATPAKESHVDDSALAKAPAVPAPNVAAPAAERLEKRKDSLMYDLRVLEVRRCDESGGHDSAIQLGVRVAVTTHVEGLFLAPRDFTLEHDGVIFQANDPRGMPASCNSPLLARSLRRGAVAEGTITFSLPDGHYARGAHLVYEATRWGGAPRIALTVPEPKLDDREVAARQKGAKLGRPGL